MDLTLPTQLRRRTWSFVDEYSGAVAPGRVIAIAVTTARAMWRRRAYDPEFLTAWEASVRRRLSAEHSSALTRAAHPAA